MKLYCRHLQWNGIFEVALLKVPQVVVYKANSVSLRIAKVFVKVKYFSLQILSLTAQPLPSFCKRVTPNAFLLYMSNPSEQQVQFHITRSWCRR